MVLIVLKGMFAGKCEELQMADGQIVDGQIVDVQVFFMLRNETSLKNHLIETMC